MMTSDTNVEHWKKFGRWLRAARIERSRKTGQPRHEIAALCGVHDNSWANWERGGRNMQGSWVTYRPKNENLYGIARALDIAPADVFARAGVRMDEDVLVTVGPDGDDRIAWLMDAVGKLSEKLDALVEAQPHLKAEIEEVREKMPRRRARAT